MIEQLFSERPSVEQNCTTTKQSVGLHFILRCNIQRPGHLLKHFGRPIHYLHPSPNVDALLSLHWICVGSTILFTYLSLSFTNNYQVFFSSVNLFVCPFLFASLILFFLFFFFESLLVFCLYACLLTLVGVFVVWLWFVLFVCICVFCGFFKNFIHSLSQKMVLSILSFNGILQFFIQSSLFLFFNHHHCFSSAHACIQFFEHSSLLLDLKSGKQQRWHHDKSPTRHRHPIFSTLWTTKVLIFVCENYFP